MAHGHCGDSVLMPASNIESLPRLYVHGQYSSVNRSQDSDVPRWGDRDSGYPVDLLAMRCDNLARPQSPQRSGTLGRSCGEQPSGCIPLKRAHYSTFKVSLSERCSGRSGAKTDRVIEACNGDFLLLTDELNIFHRRGEVD